MFILLNGAFGIGKTTAATRLAGEAADAAIYDPERVGFALRRLPAWTLGLARQPADYQDLRLWRTLIARGARRRHRNAAAVIVPMTFTNIGYLNELASALASAAPVRRICLVAPLEVVRARIEARGRETGTSPAALQFQLRRSGECVEAHRDTAFGTPVDATLPAAEIVAEIRSIAGI
jgi:hypothetical protein